MKERYNRCLRFGDITGNGIVFDWGLAGPNGAWFLLFKEPQHTKDDIDRAKHWLRQRRDVVSIETQEINQ